MQFEIIGKVKTINPDPVVVNKLSYNKITMDTRDIRNLEVYVPSLFNTRYGVGDMLKCSGCSFYSTDKNPKKQPSIVCTTCVVTDEESLIIDLEFNCRVLFLYPSRSFMMDRNGEVHKIILYGNAFGLEDSYIAMNLKLSKTLCERALDEIREESWVDLYGYLKQEVNTGNLVINVKDFKINKLAEHGRTLDQHLKDYKAGRRTPR